MMENAKKCTRCGSGFSASKNACFAVCGSTTQWQKNNYPSPNTLTTTYDDLATWPLGLCDSCMPSGYKRYLKRELDDVVLRLCLFGFMLIIAVLGIYFRATGHILVAVAVTFGLLAGIIGVPYYAIRFLIRLVIMSKFKKMPKVPEQQIDKCFVGEGERIISALQSNKKDSNERVFGEFKLPQFKDITELQLSDEGRKKIRPLVRERKIVSVGYTLEEARSKLPNGWEPIWRKVSASGGTDAEQADPTAER